MAPLQVLEETYCGQGFHVMGFYSDDFGMQGGDPNACSEMYMATFPQFAVDHVSGAMAQPVWQWLLAQPNATPPDWNFNKYLISRDGQFVQHFPRLTEPNDPFVIAAIEAELAK